MARRRKVVFLGFCSGNRALVRKWAHDGTLPHLQTLMRRGIVGNTGALRGFYVGSTWPSIYTGVSPARHGRYYHSQLVPGTYASDRRPAGERVRREPFWNALSDAGRTVAVLDIPHSAPAQRLNGIQLVGWDVHDSDYDEVRSFPDHLAGDILRRFGNNPARGSCDGPRDTDGYVHFRKHLVDGVAQKLELTKAMLAQDDWDFFGQVFTEGHCAGHQCWHFHDATHPLHDREAARVVGDPVRDAYVAIDAAIGSIVTGLDDDTTVIVLLSHGMGPKYTGQNFVDRILIGLDLAREAPKKQREPSRSRLGPLDPLVTRAYQRLPAAVRERLHPLRDRARRVIDREIDPHRSTLARAQSRCFSVYNNAAHSGLRVNLIGREPDGKVAPGAELEALWQALRTDLMDLRNLDTGDPVVRRVVRTSEEYRGDCLDHLPDFAIEWDSRAPIRRIGSARLGELRDDSPYKRTGDHVPGGMFIAAGPSFGSGELARQVSTMDIAPTITSLLGVPMEDIDGRPIEEICGAARAR